MPRKRISTLLLVIAGSALLLIKTGCGGDELPGPGGGASVDPSVKLKPPALASSDFTAAAPQNGDGGNGADSTQEPVAEGFGTIVGSVSFGGPVPTLPEVVASKDTGTCKSYPSERLVVSGNGGVANVFVYLERAPKNGSKVAQDVVQVFDQEACKFLPHAMVVGTGQRINVLSADPIAHNTHTKPKFNSEFNQGVPPGDREGKVNFSYRRAEKEPVRVVCDFHSWMEAWHLPLDHPYAAVTDAEGKFRIENMPSGVHRFKVWHEGCGFLESRLEIRVDADQETEITIDYPSAKFAGNGAVQTKSIRLALGY